METPGWVPIQEWPGTLVAAADRKLSVPMSCPLRQRLCQRRPPPIRKLGTSGLEARDPIVARVISSVLERSRSRLPAASFSATSPLAEIFCPQFDVVSTALFGLADSLIELFNRFGAVDAVKTPQQVLFYSPTPVQRCDRARIVRVLPSSSGST